MKKEAGLAILKRSNLYRGNISVHKFEGGQGENTVNIFCTHYQHSHSARGSLLYHSELHPGKGSVNFLWVWGFGPWREWLTSTKCIPLGLLRLSDYSVPHTAVFYHKIRMPVYYKNTYPGYLPQKIKISLLNRYLLLCVCSKHILKVLCEIEISYILSHYKTTYNCN